MSGWVKLHRQFEKWEWYDDINTKVLFIHLLLKANHKSNKWRGIKIARGQLVTSISKLSEQTHISQQSIRTALGKLESTGEINKQSTSKLTKITVCNYLTYQGEESDANKQSTGKSTKKQQGINKVATTNKNVKNEEKEEEIDYSTMDLSPYPEKRKK